MSCDPSGPVDELNLYVYVSNNPILYTDPDGSEKKGFFGWLGSKVDAAVSKAEDTASKAGRFIQDTTNKAIEATGIEDTDAADVIRDIAVVPATLAHTAIEGSAKLAAVIPSAIVGLGDSGTDLGEGSARVLTGDVEGGLEQIADSTGLLTAGTNIGEGLARIAEGETAEGSEQLIQGATSGTLHAIGGVGTSRVVGAGFKKLKGKIQGRKNVQARRQRKSSRRDEPSASGSQSSASKRNIENISKEPTQKLYHKGELTEGKVDPRRRLSTGTDKEAVSALDRAGDVHEFEVPKRKLYEWESEGRARQVTDYDQTTGVVNDEWRIDPPASGEMNKYKK